MSTTGSTEPKGSEGSSPDDPCRNCGHGRRQHPALTQGRCTGEVLTPAGDDRNNCPCKIFWPAHIPMAGPIDLRATPPEPKGSTQSPQDFCGQCRHHRRYHNTEYCEVCPAFTDSYRHTFVEAEPEPAGEPEAPHEHDWVGGVEGYPGRWVGRRMCQSCGAEEAAPEPEAPEEPAWCSHKPGCPHWGPSPEAPPPRPPYAGAYELEDGTAFEVALPGDATVRLDGGALVITHTGRPIRAMTQNRPLEGA